MKSKRKSRQIKRKSRQIRRKKCSKRKKCSRRKSRYIGGCQVSENALTMIYGSNSNSDTDVSLKELCIFINNELLVLNSPDLMYKELLKDQNQPYLNKIQNGFIIFNKRNPSFDIITNFPKLEEQVKKYFKKEQNGGVAGASNTPSNSYFTIAVGVVVLSLLIIALIGIAIAFPPFGLCLLMAVSSMPGIIPGFSSETSPEPLEKVSGGNGSKEEKQVEEVMNNIENNLTDGQKEVIEKTAEEIITTPPDKTVLPQIVKLINEEKEDENEEIVIEI